MTRKEQIENAAKKYATHWVDTKETDFHGNYNQEWGFVLPEYNAFVAGVKWADSNPNFPWISVDDDLPCKHSQLLENVNYTQSVLVVLSWNDDPTKKHIETAYMCNKIGSFDVNWYWENRAHYHVTHWMPLPELPTKEQEIKSWE